MEFSSDDERSADRLIGSFGMDDRAEVDATLHGIMQNCRIETCSGMGYIMI
jgi:hypothetical protein